MGAEADKPRGGGRLSYEHIPGKLRDAHNWVCFMLADNPQKGTPDKVPINPHTLRGASTTNPRAWGRLEQAAAQIGKVGCCKRGGHFISKAVTGVGFVFDGSGIVGVDFDHCIENGKLAPWVAEWVRRFDSYTEYSPSETGIHILCKGSLSGKKALKRPEVEIYDRARYFTVTGKPYDDAKPLRDAQDALDALYKQFSVNPKPVPPVACTAPAMADSDLIEKMLNAQNGAAFAALWAGDITGYGSQSEADLALCNMLAFWTGRNTEQMDRLFRQSGLMREKWDRRQSGSTYGALTVGKAARECQMAYDPDGYRKATAAQDFSNTPRKKLKIKRMSHIRPRKARYLIYPYLPRGKLTIVGGVSGSTKTWWVLDVARLISTGGHFYTDDGLTPAIKPGIVIYQTKENDYETDIRPRLDKLGANNENILVIDDRDDDGNGFPLTLTDGRIEQACEEYHPSILIFDPIQSYIGADVDFHKANEVRPVLDCLISIAERFDCAVVLISHMSKKTDQGALDRLLGSSDFRNAARSIIIIGSDPDDPETRILAHAKNSLGRQGESLKYHIDDQKGVIYDGYSELSEDDIVRSAAGFRKQGEREKPSERLNAAVDDLHELLGNGDAIRQGDALKLLLSGQYARDTLYRARSMLDLQTIQFGKPPNRQVWWVRNGIDTDEFKALHGFSQQNEIQDIL